MRPCLCHGSRGDLGRTPLLLLCSLGDGFVSGVVLFLFFEEVSWVGEISLLITSAPKGTPPGFSLVPFANDRHEDAAECVHYITGPTGTRVGCHFDELGEPRKTDNYFFLVNGTSRETAIPFLDLVPFEASKIGKRPPRCVSPPPTCHPGPRAPLLCACAAAEGDAGLGSGPA